MSARYPADILATAVVPWTEQWTLDERLFRRELELMLADGHRHLYIFGTAGEGYAVNDEQFLQITRVFVDGLRGSGVEPMVGVISLSLPTIIARIEAARDLGVRQFQISLPSWGALDEGEVFRFFDHVLGRFPDCRFLHYNLLRTKRLVTPDEYARLAAAHPNLVATKNTADIMSRVRDLLEKAPMLRHFLGESGYSYGSLIGECGLLISAASTNMRAGREFFEAGRARDVAKLIRLEGEIHWITGELLRVVTDGERIDGAYDKVLWKIHDLEFPLRMLPPYSAAKPDAAERLLAFLRENLPHWAPS
jgi:dihydrodipicolinate synthase/N-acetylneuraminate lyase